MKSASATHTREDVADAAEDPGLAPVSALPGVGPSLTLALERLGISRVQDLWFHLPLRYEDRTRITAIRDARIGEAAQVCGVVEAVERGFRYRPQLRVAVSDASGSTLSLRFFHFRAAQAAQFNPGARIRCYGDVRLGAHGPEMVHPQYARLRDDETVLPEPCLTPIYPTTQGLGQKRLAALIARALERLPDEACLELIPLPLRASLQLGSLRQALLGVHRPAPGSDGEALVAHAHPGQTRLAFEELMAHHVSLRRLRQRLQDRSAHAMVGKGRLRLRLLRNLPFELTAAQQRVLGEILADLAKPVPMLRLVQGDVGSGKTVVAALAAMEAIDAGCQVALMAPTELLADQHRRLLCDWLAPLSIQPVWLAGKVKGRARQTALAAVAAGAPLVIGTHALMQESVEFARLALVIIDEQHRFGVHQRLTLRDKGLDGNAVPHQLVLTATPIPRTLAMSAYADLDVSVVDELPPGRKPVRTVAISSVRRADVVERIRTVCREGRQVYWVCTIIEESDLLEAQAAEVAFAELCIALPNITIGLVHGRMKASEKVAAMDAFKAGSTQLLVATTVIEVGVDVANASLMVIENAERLGLAQLHQLRGRVGRGDCPSTCVLLYRGPLSDPSRARLEVMRETHDGFRIAEKDLELRGPGELLGTRQTGQLEFRVADLVRDARLLPAVQRVGEELLRQYPARAERLVARWIGASTRFAGA
ncbi:MAG: ATP-dependent DNA helicase RecG [Rhodanobacteraceae bacterium]